ncbi:MAG: hypothetical protein ABII23_03280 [bacterium]
MKHKFLDTIPKGRLSFKWCILVYICLTGINLVVHNRMIDSQKTYIDARQELHADVLENKASANIQFRIMIHYAAEGLQRMGVSFNASYLILRGITTFLAAFIFHKFLACYFPIGYCFMGVLLLFGGLPVTYINYFMQETDALNLFFYIWAFLMIRSRKDAYLFPILFISVFNRETTVLIPLLWLFYRWDELPILQLVSRFFGFLAAIFIPYVGLRLMFNSNEATGESFQLMFNLNQINSYLYFMLLFGPFLILSVKGWSDKPKFIRRSMLFAPFFILFHFCLTIFQESRLVLPLFPILIPAGFCYLFGTQQQDEYQNGAAAGRLAKYSKLLYGLCFLIFIGQIWVFNLYVDKFHTNSWKQTSKTQQYMKLGNEYYMKQNFASALESFTLGLKSSPEDFNLHFNIAQIYTYHIKEHNKAYYHWSKCLKLDPDNPRIEDVLRSIELVK